MAGNPRIVAEDVTFPWDGAPQRLARGQIIDVAAGSALEDAIGRERLVPLYPPPPVAAVPPQAAETPPEPAEAQEEPDAPASASTPKGKARATAQDAKNGSDEETASPDDAKAAGTAKDGG